MRNVQGLFKMLAFSVGLTFSSGDETVRGDTPLKYYGTTRTFCKTWIKQLKKPCRSHSDYSMHQAICGSSAWVPSDLVRLTWDSFGLKVHMKLVHVRIPTRVKRTGSVTNL